MVTIESNPQDISNRLTAIEATIPHLATKADVAKLAIKDDIANMATKDDIIALSDKIGERLTSIERGQAALVRWFVSVALAFIAILTPLLLMILDRLP